MHCKLLFIKTLSVNFEKHIPGKKPGLGSYTIKPARMLKFSISQNKTTCHNFEKCRQRHLMPAVLAKRTRVVILMVGKSSLPTLSILIRPTVESERQTRREKFY